VPLPRRAVTILRDLFPLRGHGRYVFPSLPASQPDPGVLEQAVGVMFGPVARSRAALTRERTASQSLVMPGGGAPDLLAAKVVQRQRTR
jgi:hypothetical protein